MKIVTLIISIVLVVSYGATLTGREIVSKMDSTQKVQSEFRDLQLLLINKKGRVRKRNLMQYIKRYEGGLYKILTRFTAPSDIAKTSLLIVENEDRNDDTWLYLPALGKVRKISSRNKSSNFVGSDFTYKDLGYESLNNNKYTYLRSEALDNEECYVVEALPNDVEKSEGGYTKRVFWISKNKFLPLKIEYYNKSNKLYKGFKSSDIRLVEDYFKAYKMEMENKITGHKSQIIVNNYDYSTSINDDMYLLKSLEK